MSTIQYDKTTRIPSVLNVDTVAYFDPALAGGGGRLQRITTQQRERAEAEAKQRSERSGEVARLSMHDEIGEEKNRSSLHEPSPPSDHVYPDGEYGWIVVICCMALAGCCFG